MIREQLIVSIRNKNISQTTLCNDLSIQITNFNSFIRGKRAMSFRNLVMILRYLKMTVGHVSQESSSVPPEDIGKVVAGILKFNNVKLCEFAKLAGVDISTLSGITKGTRNPSTHVLDKVFDALQIKLLPYKK